MIKNILVTLGVLLAYAVGASFRAPWLPPELGLMGLSNASTLFFLGIAPFMGGFFWAEVLSFVLPPGRAYRRSGFAGRRILNRWAWILSALFALVMIGFLGAQIWENHPLLALSLGAYVLLGLAILLWLARIANDHGLGNGFALLLLGQLLGQLVAHGRQRWAGLPEQAEVAQRLGPPLLSLLVAAAILYFFWRKKTVGATAFGQPIRFELSPVPQGIYSVPLAASAFAICATLGVWLMPGMDSRWFRSDSYAYGVAAFLLLTSAFTYFTAFSPARVLHNTFGRMSFSEGEAAKVGRWAAAGAVLFLLWPLLSTVPHPLAPMRGLVEEVVPLVSLLLVIFLLKDIYLHAQFLRRVPRPVSLGAFDNIHFLALAKAVAETRDIPVCLRGFEYRRLMAYFAPLIKVELLVVPERAQELKDLLGLEDLPTV